MKRNWYAVCTKSLKERKVSNALNKKGIENYCPVISSNFNDNKPAFKPLFNSYVFVFVFESEIESIKTITDVVCVYYWKSKPAIINNDEIEIVKQLTSKYDTIKIEHSVIETNAVLKVFDNPQISINGNSISLKYKTVKVNLPSMGFTLVAERVAGKQTINQPKTQGLIASFPRVLNDFFF